MPMYYESTVRKTVSKPLLRRIAKPLLPPIVRHAKPLIPSVVRRAKRRPVLLPVVRPSSSPESKITLFSGASVLYGTAAGVYWAIETSAEEPHGGLERAVIAGFASGVISTALAAGSPVLAFLWGSFVGAYRQF